MSSSPLRPATTRSWWRPLWRTSRPATCPPCRSASARLERSARGVRRAAERRAEQSTQPRIRCGSTTAAHDHESAAHLEGCSVSIEQPMPDGDQVAAILEIVRDADEGLSAKRRGGAARGAHTDTTGRPNGHEWLASATTKRHHYWEPRETKNPAPPWKAMRGHKLPTDRVRFELTVRLHVHTLSRRAP